MLYEYDFRETFIISVFLDSHIRHNYLNHLKLQLAQAKLLNNVLSATNKLKNR